jgi:hypothetical protein
MNLVLADHVAQHRVNADLPRRAPHRPCRPNGAGARLTFRGVARILPASDRAAVRYRQAESTRSKVESLPNSAENRELAV